jgi:ankyrin repeat protein
MPMDGGVLEAAVTGDARLKKDLASQDPSVLLGTTPQGNTCLHIASIHGHQGFCNDVLTFNQSLPLLNAINADGETPLLTAMARGRATLGSVLLGFCRDQQLSETILKQDKRGFNALHHARAGADRSRASLIESCDQTFRVTHFHRGDERLWGRLGEAVGDS